MTAASPNTSPTVEQVASANIPTRFGTFRMFVYRTAEAPVTDGLGLSPEHLALVVGDVSGAQALAVRVHSECLTSEVFGSLRCDCRQQLEAAQESIVEQGVGVIVYLRQEGRGIGLANKIRAYALQDQGADTVEANRLLHLPIDGRDYGIAAAILRDLGVASVKLMTNNPNKVSGLTAHGIVVSERLPLLINASEHSAAYLETKRQKLNHEIPSDTMATARLFRK